MNPVFTAETADMISIIVPVYNAEKFIKQTIDCVRAQTYENWELLLIEDGSKDHTLEVMQAYLEELGDDRIRMGRQPGDEGAAGARNKGLSMARGRYIAFLDADDLWHPEKLEKELRFMTEKQAGFVFTGYEFGDEDANPTGRIVKVPEAISYKQALYNTTIFTSTVLADLTVVEKDLLKMPIMKSEDTATWWQILGAGHVGYGLNENLVTYRRPKKSLSSNKMEAMKRIWNLLRKAAGLSVPASAVHFVKWAFLAVYRRL